jgi:polyvinyl alcohol dehydrogenase (cytochrome)
MSYHQAGRIRRFVIGQRLVLASAVAAMGLTSAACARTPKVSGADIYKTRCASCHDQTTARMPTREALSKLSRARILRTLDFGAMMSIAYPLRRDERQAVAEYLGTAADEPAPAIVSCAADRPILAATASGDWTSWGPSFTNTRFQAADRAGLDPSKIAGLTLKWSFGFGGDVIALAAPTVYRGTVFMGSAGGVIQALDAKSGCQYWRFQAGGPVRAAPTVVADEANVTLVFGDQIGWVYGLDARTGQARWKTRVEEHEATRLTASLAVDAGVAFVPAASWEETRSIDPHYPCCTFRGSLTAIRVRDGSIAWKTYLVDAPKRTGTSSSGVDMFGPSGAGIWSTPTVDAARHALYVTTGDNYSHPASATSDAVIALDLATGRILWTRQTTPNDVYNSSCSSSGANCPPNNGPDYDFGSSAMLVRTLEGRDVLVAGQKSGVVYGLDPDRQGAIVWQARVAKGGMVGGVQWGMASDGRAVFASASDVVRKTDVLGSSLVGDAPLDPVEGGGLTALNPADGKKLWFAPSTPCAPPRPGCSPGQPGALTAIPGLVFSGAMDGHLRAFSTTDGKLRWDVDTARPYRTVNGLDGKGGSLDGAGPVIAGGMLFVNSGYPRFGGSPGNVLLAFGIN